MYLFDVHTHTVEVSPCGVMTAEETVKTYCELGYDGIVVTDHFNGGVVQRLPGTTWAEKIESFTRGYRLAKEAGDRLGLTVFFGMETKACDYDNNEYLVYGVTPQFLIEHERLYEHTLEEIYREVHLAGGLIYQAHPYRCNMVMSPACYLDGIEAYNGNPRHHSCNDVAIQTAKRLNLHMVSGSDCHQHHDAGHGGMAFFKKPETMDELLTLLTSDRYAILASRETL